MKCLKCGMNLRENDMFCPNCGEPVQKRRENSEVKNENMYTYERPMNQQSVQRNQQNYGERNNRGQKYPPTKNAGDVMKIIIIVILVLIIVVPIIIIMLSFGIMVYNSAKETVESSNTIDSDNSINNSTTTVNNNKSSSYKVLLNDFNVYIPYDYVYEINSTGEVIDIADSSLSWAAEIGISKMSLSQAKLHKNTLKNKIIETGKAKGYDFTIPNITNENIDGVNCMVFECNSNQKKEYMVLAEINSSYTMIIEYVNVYGNTTKDDLKKVVSLAKNAEYRAATSNLKTDEGFIDGVKILEGIDKLPEDENSNE